ncbi:hypothetical protein KP509_35G034500 [Ceratopteris richardii]|nr:hypothetical protein KP509_35G034500 [Ceratopteris richardii]
MAEHNASRRFQNIATVCNRSGADGSETMRGGSCLLMHEVDETQCYGVLCAECVSSCSVAITEHDEIMRSTTSESDDLHAKESTRKRSCQAEASSDGSLQSVDLGRYPDKRDDKLSFCYWISEQQRDLMFLTAGIVIQAVGFQLKSMVDVISMLIALGSQAYSSMSRVAHGIPQHDVRAIEAHTDLAHRSVMFMRRLWNLAALLIAEGKKMGLGCLRVAYVLGIIAAVILMSFTLSFVLMKTTASRQMEPLHMTYQIHFDYTQLHPAAVLHLRVHHADSLAKRRNDVDPGHIHNRCTVMLTLPESDYNRKLGVFQLVAELLSETGDVLMKSSQPCLLHFKSTALQYVKSVCLAIPLLAGLTSEAQTLRVHLLKWKQDEFTATPTTLQISLVPRMGRSGTNGLPELYKAEIELHAMDSLESSPIVTTIRNLCMWVIFNFLFFGLFSSFCMFKMCRQRKNDVPSADSLAQTEASETCKRWQPAEKVI